MRVLSCDKLRKASSSIVVILLPNKDKDVKSMFLYRLKFSIVNLKTTVQSLTFQKIRFDFYHVCGVDGDRVEIMKFIEDLAAKDCIVPKINIHG
jgi:hypothetical protein